MIEAGTLSDDPYVWSEGMAEWIVASSAFETTKTPFCISCGSSLAENANFCPECGAQTGTQYTADQSDLASDTSSTSERGTGSNRENPKIGLRIGYVAAAALVAGGLLYTGLVPDTMAHYFTDGAYVNSQIILPVEKRGFGGMLEDLTGVSLESMFVDAVGEEPIGKNQAELSAGIFGSPSENISSREKEIRRPNSTGLPDEIYARIVAFDPEFQI